MRDRHEGDENERLEAQLSLASQPPDSLDERIRLRRERGDRVLLPVPPSAEQRPRWRQAVLPAALVAAAVLAAVAVSQWRHQGSDEQQPRVAAGDSDVAPPQAAPPIDSAPRPPGQRPGPAIPGGLPAVDVVSTFDGRGYPAGTLFATTMDALRQASIDSAASVASARTAIIVRNAEEGVAAATAARALADTVAAALRSRGVPSASITLLRGSSPVGEPRLQPGEVRILVRERAP